jgi:hypothetical protein
MKSLHENDAMQRLISLTKRTVAVNLAGIEEQLPNGQLAPKKHRAIPQEIQADIMYRYDVLGQKPADIGRVLLMARKSVEGVIYREKRRRRQKASNRPVAGGRGEDVKISQATPESAFQKPSDVDLIISGMEGQPYNRISDRIYKEIGMVWTTDDVAKRIAEMNKDAIY